MIRKIDSLLFCQDNEFSERWRTHFNLVQDIPLDPITVYIVRLDSEGTEIGASLVTRVAHQFPDGQDTWTFHCSVLLPLIYDVDFGPILTRFSNTVFQWKDNGTVQAELYYDNETSTFKVYRGSSDSGVLVGETSSFSDPTPAERGFGELIWRIKINSTQGEFDVVWNNVLIGSGRSLNTQVTENASANEIYIGDFTGDIDLSIPKIYNVMICDGQGVAPYNGIVGHVRVKGMFPNEVGTHTEWVGAGFVAIPQNWYRVSFRSPQTTQFNWAPEVGAIDTYGVETSYYPPIEGPSPPAFQGTCFAICIHPIAYNAEPPTSIFTPAPTSDGIVKPVLIIGAEREDGPAETLDAIYKGYPWILTANPFTGVGFTEEDLTNLQAGIILVS